MKLLEIPGVGSRIRDRLLEHCGSEEKAMDVILAGDVEELLKVVSERQALSLAQWAKGVKHDAGPDGFLATDEAVKIYEALLSRIRSYAHTDYARLKIGTLYPTSSKGLLEENRAEAMASMDLASRLSGTQIGDLLATIKPLRDRPCQRVRDRAVAAASLEALQELKDRGLDKLIDIHLAETPREMVDLADGYSHVCVVGSSVSSAECLESAQSLECWYLVPEAVLGYYKENEEILTAAAKAGMILEDLGIRSFQGLGELSTPLSGLEAGFDEESSRLTRILERLTSQAREASAWANLELKRRAESTSVTLAGSDLLQAMGRGEGIREIFEVQMRGVFQEVMKEARARAISRLELSGPEAARLEEAFTSEIGYPIELDFEALRSLEQDLRSKLEHRVLGSKRNLARGLADKRVQAESLVRALMEFDYLYALGSFALAEGLVMPEISDEMCMGIVDGKNMFLKNADPISYSLGNTGMEKHTERIAILSGVNSGGKTTLLDLISQVVILSHMGLPVPARRCRMGIFQEIYYFSKSRGTLSAGAFETAMRKFAVVENRKRKLVLADELEAITEPGASARIIACMLDELNRLGSVAVFVSHLAEEIKRFAETPVRVDGIEAEGLDSNNNLIVRRSPRYNYLAKSTPELILDRLVRTTSGAEKDFYSRLLAKFRGPF